MILPKPSGDFEWVQESWGAALRCRPLARVAPHCFSTRDLVLGAPDADAEGWTLLARGLGVPVGGLIRLRQVHGAEVFEVATGARLETPAVPPDADIAITRRTDVALSVRAADCVPTLLADAETGGVAAVHAGWKGTAAGAVAVAVEALESRYGTSPANIVAAIGPAIGPCCYEVGPELIERFAAHRGAARWFSAGSRPRLDLWTATRDQLVEAGVPPPQIHLSGLCTFDHPALLHSYRRDRGAAGRLVAAIRSAPGRTP